MRIPDAWYNLSADLDFQVPGDIAGESAGRAGRTAFDPQVPLSLVRQERSRKQWIPIPAEVRDRYAMWRPTPLRRAAQLEAALGTRSRIYYKYEGGNLTGSHKLNTAVAQAFYYKAAGARRLAVATGAGQWGTAVAAACQMFGLDCHVYMVRASLESKPYRRTMMELLGASVSASPSDGTEIGRRFLRDGHERGTLSIALAEAVADTSEPGTRFCAGSGETYSLLHQSVIGLEARDQLAGMDREPDVVIAALGAGSNFGGIAFPFLRSRLSGGAVVRCLSAEPAACPKLTRGRYAYDYTDSSEQTPLQKMFTLGYRFTPPPWPRAPLRYHGTAKIISALYHRELIEAVAYQQRAVFESAVLFSRCEGILPAPESAHAVHGAVCEARAADRRGEPAVILFSLSGHGLFDIAAYRAYLNGEISDIDLPDSVIEESLAQLPRQPDLAMSSAR